MNELYWLTRLDSLNNCLSAFLILSSVACAAFIIINCITSTDVADGITSESEEFWKNRSAKWIKGLIPSVIVLALSVVFVPTTKEAFIIYGVGGTIDYLKTDETAKQIPHKVIMALDKCIEYITPNEENNKQH